MHDPDKLRAQLTQLGTRYLNRTLGEVRRIHELAAQVQGATGPLKDLELLAHKIHGSGAMFGFERMSEYAGEIEHTAAYLARREGPEHLQGVSEAELHERLLQSIARLEAETRTAAQQRGIDMNAG